MPVIDASMRRLCCMQVAQLPTGTQASDIANSAANLAKYTAFMLQISAPGNVCLVPANLCFAEELGYHLCYHPLSILQRNNAAVLAV